MQSLMGKFFKPISGEGRVEQHNYLHEKERADTVKRLRAEEDAELDDLKALVDRDDERLERRKQEKQRATEKERQGRLKRHASLSEGREIVPNLFLGGRMAAQNWEWLDANSIRTVLNVTPDVTNYYQGEESFEYCRIEVEDTKRSNLANHFDESGTFIRNCLENGRPIFVHCREGLSRSPTIIIAFLMQHMEMTLQTALSAVEDKNGMIRINDGFMRQLADLERELFGSESTVLFDPKERAEKVSYDDMTAAEKREFDLKQAKKNRVRKRPLSLKEFMELKSKQILEKRAKEEEEEGELNLI